MLLTCYLAWKQDVNSIKKNKKTHLLHVLNEQYRMISIMMSKRTKQIKTQTRLLIFKQTFHPLQLIASILILMENNNLILLMSLNQCEFTIIC